MPRTVTAHTALGEDQLKFRAMRGTEGLSQLFEFEVELASPSPSLDLQAMLGKPLSLAILTDSGATRWLSGEVTRFERVGRAGTTERQHVYRAMVRPALWYLTRTVDCRIFQNKSVPEILGEMFARYGLNVAQRLGGSYRPWEYCVQYQESDFAFVSRLMEHEGIAYHFEHARDSHTLVLADDIAAHRTLPNAPFIDYLPPDRVLDAMRGCIDRWQVAEEITSGRVSLDDFDFRKPKASLEGVVHGAAAHDHSQYEVYEWPGGYVEHAHAEQYAKIRLQELQCARERAHAHSNVRDIAPGHLFTLRQSPREAENREYLIVEARYALQEPDYASGGELSALADIEFVALPSHIPFRPARRTPRPRTHGPQTATVVGPEEIWTDRYGRVKLQFRWDRYGHADENSSCWVRVSSHWAGAGFGAIHLPRVGQEVIVDFIGGEPDRPIVTGRVYNDDQMPPWALPASASQSGVLSRSVDGHAENANALRFEDKPGAEQIWLHAERNLDTEVEADETHTVGGHRTTAITGNEQLDVQGTRATTIQGHESATYHSGEERTIHAGATETIDGGQTRTVSGGLSETIDGGETRTVSGGRTETVSGGETRSITGGQTQTIDGGQTETVTGGQTLTVSGGATWTVDSGLTTTVDGSETHTTNGPRTEVITGGETRTITGTVTENVSNTIIVNAPNVTYNVTKHTVNASDEGYWRSNASYGTALRYNVVVSSFDLWGIRAQLYAGLNLQVAAVKIDISAFRNKDNGLSLEASGANVKAAGAKIRSGGLAIQSKIMSIFN